MSSTRAANVVAMLADAGPTVSVPLTAKCLGIHEVTAYELARRGELGVPVLRVGRRVRVPTAALRRYLGIDPGSTVVSEPQGAA